MRRRDHLCFWWRATYLACRPPHPHPLPVRENRAVFLVLQPRGVCFSVLQPRGLQPCGVFLSVLQPRGLQPRGVCFSVLQPRGLQPRGVFLSTSAAWSSAAWCAARPAGEGGGCHGGVRPGAATVRVRDVMAWERGLCGSPCSGCLAVRPRSSLSMAELTRTVGACELIQGAVGLGLQTLPASSRH